MRKKALFAIIFAGGMLSPQIPAMTEEVESTPDVFIKKVATASEASPEARAFCLLLMANDYQAGKSQAEAEKHFTSASQLESLGRIMSNKNNIYLVMWAEGLASSARAQSYDDKESNIQAGKAIAEALKILNSASNTPEKFYVSFIASSVSKTTGNHALVKRAERGLENALQHCSRTNPQEIRAALSVLNMMASNYVPIRISDNDQRINNRQMEKTFTDEELRAAEKLRLRGIALADNLPADAHARRKAHRDMSLWYSKVGKTALAGKEKQILFKLVGIDDDRLLYPLIKSCGHVVWWQPGESNYGPACGMG